MVDRAVDHGCSEDVAEAEGLVAGDDQAGSFVAVGDELEEQVHGFGFEGDVADPRRRSAVPSINYRLLHNDGRPGRFGAGNNGSNTAHRTSVRSNRLVTPRVVHEVSGFRFCLIAEPSTGDLAISRSPTRRTVTPTQAPPPTSTQDLAHLRIGDALTASAARASPGGNTEGEERAFLKLVGPSHGRYRGNVGPHAATAFHVRWPAI